MGIKIDISCDDFPNAFIVCEKDWDGRFCFWMFPDKHSFKFPWTRRQSTRPQMEGAGIQSLEEAKLSAISLLKKRSSDWEVFCKTESGHKYVSGLISENELFELHLKELRCTK